MADATTPRPDQENAPTAAVDAQAAENAAKADAPDPAGPKRVAVICAHPDDAEFLCAGTVARWTAEGHQVTFVLLTSGDKGSDDPALTGEQLVATREREQRAACEILGVHEVVFLRYADAMLVPDLDLRRTLTRVIRQLTPDVVICQDPTVHWFAQSYLNHPDHRAAGEATLAAIYPAARDRLTFPELLEEGLEPHKVTEVYLAGPENADVWIDISAHFETKIAALRAHASQVGDWEFEPLVRDWAKAAAATANQDGWEYAEGFKYFKLD